MKHYSVLAHCYTNFELNYSKFAQVTKFRENFQEIQNKKIKTLQSILAKFNTKGPLLMYYICVQFQDDCWNFTKVRATTDIFQKIRNPIKSQIGRQFKIHCCCTKFQLDISSLLWIIVVWKLESRAHTLTRTHTYIHNIKIIKKLTLLIWTKFLENKGQSLLYWNQIPMR